MDAPAGEIVLPKLLSDLRTQLDGLTVPRHCASVDACAKLPVKDTVDVGCSQSRVICKQIVDGFVNYCKLAVLLPGEDTTEESPVVWIL